MAKRSKYTSIAAKFPIKGLEKRWGYQGQGPFSTVDCDNIWPTQWATGRERGGTRPGLRGAGPISFSSPLNWSEATWQSGTGTTGIRRGVAVASRWGVKVSYFAGLDFNSEDTTFTSTDPFTGANSDFASCTVYLQHIFFAIGGRELGVKVKPLPGLPTSVTTWDGDLEAIEGVVGEPPKRCGIAQTWGDRLVLAGDTENPHVVYMCRVGNPIDWDYSAVDAGAAWANSGGEDGKIGEPITSLIPHNRDCLLVGCTDSLYVVRGNPKLQGQKYQLSQTVGPLMQSAWCKSADDSTWIFTRDGLYVMRPGCGEPPIAVSREMLPEDLTAIDPARTTDFASIGYDTRWRGIHIYANRDGTDLNYFYDIQSGGFWPMSFSDTPRLAVNFKSLSSINRSGLVMVTSQGYSRQFDKTRPCEKPAYLWYGPFALGDPFTEGILLEVASVLGSQTDNPDDTDPFRGYVKWEVHAGESPEQAYKNGQVFKGTEWKREGLNYTQNPAIRGTTCYIKVFNDAYRAWTIEEITLLSQLAGRRTVG